MGRRWRRRRAKPSRPPCRSLLDLSDTRLKDTIFGLTPRKCADTRIPKSSPHSFLLGAREEARVKTDREEGGLGQHPTMRLGTRLQASILTILPLLAQADESTHRYAEGESIKLWVNKVSFLHPRLPPRRRLLPSFCSFGPSPGRWARITTRRRRTSITRCPSAQRSP